MRLSLPCAVTTFIVLATAKPIPDSHVIHEERGLPGHALDSRWVKRDRLEKDRVLPMRIGLKQQNLHKGSEWLLDV